MFEKSIADNDSGMYLGNQKVVGKLVGQFIDSVVNAGNINVLYATINKYADIFLGLYDDYRVVDGWNDSEGLGRVFSRRLSVSHEQASTDLFRSAFGVLARYALTIVKESPGKSEDAVKSEVDSLRKYMTAMLLGTVDTLYPGDKGWKSGEINDLKKPSVSYHPKCNDHGQKVPIHKPSRATPIESFNDPQAIASVLPQGRRPESLNGILFASWQDAPRTLHGWADVDGQIEIDEPEFTIPKGKKGSAGVVIKEPDGRVWVVHPTNQYGNHEATFPKGTLEPGLPMQAAAIKEAYEEAGLQVKITGFLGDVLRTTSVARYYLAERIGGDPADMSWESQCVSLVPMSELPSIVTAKADAALIAMLQQR